MTVLPSQPTNSEASISTLVDLLRHRADDRADAIAFTFLENGEQERDRWSYGVLDRRARAIAARLQSSHSPGDRVLLLYPPGLEFIAAFFGCLYAGAIAVPVYPPRRNHHLHRLQAVFEDADATVAMTTQDISDRIGPWLAEVPALKAIEWYATDELDDSMAANWHPPDICGDSLAFLQYTSGSTGNPKGVMVTHANLLHSCADQAVTWKFGPDSINVTWLPVFHDLGLIYGILQPIYQGISCYVMAPASFLQRPVRWLQAISKYRATHSAAPNFAYELCAQKVSPEQRSRLDLSCWQMAMNGAEPVRPSTMDKFGAIFAECGFNPTAQCPAYGLAEATLKVTAIAQPEDPVSLTVDARELSADRVVTRNSNASDTIALASCGRAVLDTQIAIVHPDRFSECQPYEIGEIWIAGPLVAKGYWRNREATAATFQARTVGGDGPFLRTGDLGFLDDRGSLFVTGRLKDLIIIDGANYYPQDIEQTVESCHPGLQLGASAAFAIDDRGRDRLVVVQELERTYLRHPNLDSIIAAIRKAIAERHDLPVHSVVLLRTASIPKTSSGKIQRQSCRRDFLAGTLNVVRDWSCDPHYQSSFLQLSSQIDSVSQQLQDKPPPKLESPRESVPVSPPQLSAIAVQTTIAQRLADRLNVTLEAIDFHESFTYHGLTSREAVELLADLETELNCSLSPTILYDYPTIASLSRYIVGESVVPNPIASPVSPPFSTDTDAIAIVGMGCRFPGANNPDRFWELLKQGKDAISNVPADRWQSDRFPDNMAGLHQGGFLPDIDRFDAEFFGISHREAERMDPQQRLVLEVAWEALENAGVRSDRLAGSNTGVFLGLTFHDYVWQQFNDFAAIDAYAGTGNVHCIAANRLSYWLDLHGPSMAVDTSCSSSLVSVHLAAQNLRLGECDLAIAGGVNTILTPRINLAFSNAGMLAADGRCKTFDASANGYVRSEGCGIILLKRLADAVRDGDRVLAVLRSTVVNQDGRTNGLTAPNGKAQQAMIRKALERAGLQPHHLGYMEAHGTGTSLGDPIELGALKAVLAEGRSPDDTCWIGSVKANIGHPESAAGIAGLIKTVLVLQHGEIPAQLHLQELNPLIDFQDTPFKIATSHQPWTTGERRRAGVSSFGFGGTNAHAILEEAPVSRVPKSDNSLNRPYHLLTLSARQATGLTELVNRYRTFLQETDADIDDICYTANACRMPFKHRLAVVGQTIEEIRDRLSQYPQASDIWTGEGQSSEAKISFLFPDRTHPGMGRQLYKTSPMFRDAIDSCNEIFQETLGDLLDSDTPSVWFAIEYALAQLWQSWGIQSDRLMAEGTGEFVAACIAGVFSLEDGLKLLAQLDASPSEFASVASSISYSPARFPIVSTVTGEEVTEAIATSEYWIQKHRQLTQPVTAMSVEAASNETIVIEMGTYHSLSPKPVGALAKPAQSAYGVRPSPKTPQERGHKKDDWQTLLESLAQLSVRGIAIDWDTFYAPYSPRRVTLPNYPFQRQRCWLEGETIATTLPDKSEKSKPEESESATWLRQIEATKERDRQPLLVRLLQEEFARVLGRSSPDDIEPDRGFFEMGFDSLSISTLRARLERELNCSLSPTIGFNYPTIDALSGYLLNTVLTANDEPQPTVTAPTPSKIAIDFNKLEQHSNSESSRHSAELEAIEQLSDPEAEALLLEKLAAIECRG